MKKTELVFILDRSGSMGGLEKDTIGGFNAMIEKQKKEEGECTVYTLLFDHKLKLLHDRVKLSEIQPLTEEDYTVRGSTALYDAIGFAIRDIGWLHEVHGSENAPEKTMFVIVTDGMENASQKYTESQIKKLIEQKKKKNGWEFLFIGANIDATETAEEIGIDRDFAVDYIADSKGTDAVFKGISCAVSSLRCNKSISKNWSDEIKRDYKRK